MSKVFVQAETFLTQSKGVVIGHRLSMISVPWLCVTNLGARRSSVLLVCAIMIIKIFSHKHDVSNSLDGPRVVALNNLFLQEPITRSVQLP